MPDRFSSIHSDAYPGVVAIHGDGFRVIVDQRGKNFRVQVRNRKLTGPDWVGQKYSATLSALLKRFSLEYRWLGSACSAFPDLPRDAAKAHVEHCEAQALAYNQNDIRHSEYLGIVARFGPLRLIVSHFAADDAYVYHLQTIDTRLLSSLDPDDFGFSNHWVIISGRNNRDDFHDFVFGFMQGADPDDPTYDGIFEAIAGLPAMADDFGLDKILPDRPIPLHAQDGPEYLSLRSSRRLTPPECLG